MLRPITFASLIIAIMFASGFAYARDVSISSDCSIDRNLLVHRPVAACFELDDYSASITKSGTARFLEQL